MGVFCDRFLWGNIVIDVISDGLNDYDGRVESLLANQQLLSMVRQLDSRQVGDQANKFSQVVASFSTDPAIRSQVTLMALLEIGRSGAWRSLPKETQQQFQQFWQAVSQTQVAQFSEYKEPLKTANTQQEWQGTFQYDLLIDGIQAENQRFLKFASTECPQISTVVTEQFQESFSSLYQYGFEIALKQPLQDTTALLNKSVQLTVTEFTTGSKNNNKYTRYIHGKIAYIADTHVNTSAIFPHAAKSKIYQIVIVPELFELTRCRQSRVFVGQTPQKIIEAILQPYQLKMKVADQLKSELATEPTVRPVLQTAYETDWQLLGRVLSLAGAVSYFEHDKEQYTWVMIDQSEASTFKETTPKVIGMCHGQFLGDQSEQRLCGGYGWTSGRALDAPEMRVVAVNHDDPTKPFQSDKPSAASFVAPYAVSDNDNAKQFATNLQKQQQFLSQDILFDCNIASLQVGQQLQIDEKPYVIVSLVLRAKPLIGNVTQQANANLGQPFFYRVQIRPLDTNVLPRATMQASMSFEQGLISGCVCDEKGSIEPQATAVVADDYGRVYVKLDNIETVGDPLVAQVLQSHTIMDLPHVGCTVLLNQMMDGSFVVMGATINKVGTTPVEKDQLAHQTVMTSSHQRGDQNQTQNAVQLEGKDGVLALLAATHKSSLTMGADQSIKLGNESGAYIEVSPKGVITLRGSSEAQAQIKMDEKGNIVLQASDTTRLTMSASGELIVKAAKCEFTLSDLLKVTADKLLELESKDAASLNAKNTAVTAENNMSLKANHEMAMNAGAELKQKAELVVTKASEFEVKANMNVVS